MNTPAMALGAMYFGTSVDERTAFSILDRYAELGGAFIDTSDNYSFWTSETGFGGQSEALLGLCRALRAAPGESWTLENSARRVNVSSRTLARRFYQETGLQFSDWVRRARLMEALTRLARGDSVLAVSLELGYESPSAFSAMFRRLLGVSPTDYFPPAETGLPR